MPDNYNTPQPSFTDFNFDVNSLYQALSNRFNAMTAQPSVGQTAAIGEDAIAGLRRAARQLGGVPKINLAQIKPNIQKTTRVKGVNINGSR